MIKVGRVGWIMVCRGKHEGDSSDSVTGEKPDVSEFLPVMESDVSPFTPAAACPEWKDTKGRPAKDG